MKNDTLYRLLLTLAFLGLCAPSLTAQTRREERDALERHRPAPRSGRWNATSVGADDTPPVPEGIQFIHWDSLDEEVLKIEKDLSTKTTEPEDAPQAEKDTIDHITLPASTGDMVKLRTQLVMTKNGLSADYETDIVPALRWFLSDHARATKVILRRFARYEETFREIFAKAGVPEDIAALCIVESGVNPRAESPAGAVGMWQFMEETAVGCGLTVTGLRDDRLDPIRSAYAATRYLKREYRRFGDWSLAIASYNCGPGGIQKAMKKAGSDRYEDLSAYLPKETQAYLPRLIAAIYCIYFTQQQ